MASETVVERSTEVFKIVHAAMAPPPGENF